MATHYADLLLAVFSDGNVRELRGKGTHMLQRNGERQFGGSFPVRWRNKGLEKFILQLLLMNGTVSL